MNANKLYCCNEIDSSQKDSQKYFSNKLTGLYV